MTHIRRTFDTKPEEFNVSISKNGYLTSAEYRVSIKENTKDGEVTGYEAECNYVLRNEPATKKSIVNALLACNDDYKDRESYTNKVIEYADSIITG